MKKLIIILLIILSIICLTAFTNKGSTLINISKQIKIEQDSSKGIVSKEVLEYCRKFNKNISPKDIQLLLNYHNKIKKLHKDFAAYQEEIGVLVNVEKNPEKEPIPLEELPIEIQREYNTKLKNLWNEEIKFLELRHEKGMVSDKDFKEDYKNFKEIRDNI